MKPSRRAALGRLCALSGFGLASGFFGGLGNGLASDITPAPPATARVVEVEARRFKYTPDRIMLRRGEAVILAFRSIDFVHGFSAPDFGLRADLLPGRITQVALQPMTAGSFAFLCDNFCGDGHEGMGGTFVVEG